MKPCMPYRMILFFLYTYLFFINTGALGIQSRYDISFDPNGNFISGSGDGYGDGWYYYPDSGVFRQWYHNASFDNTRKAELDIWMYIEVVDPNFMVNYTISCGWSTPQWNIDGDDGPPLPTTLPGGNESPYIKDKLLYSEQNLILLETSSIEPRIQLEVSDYNPQWVCITVTGDNVHVYRWINHECVDNTAQGACCNTSSGDCYISTEEDCVGTRQWLGAESTCDDCMVAGRHLDFGDAPQVYPVLRMDDGARHVIGSGLYLGDSVSAENDGQPNDQAHGDQDDGVQFLSFLKPGQEATIKVSASQQGFLSAWLDTNQDGDWSDPTEQVLVDEHLIPGDNILPWLVPPTSHLGETFMRFRLSSAAGLGVTGLSSDGEVEDYSVSIKDPADTPDTHSPSTQLAALYKQRLMTPASGQTFLPGWPSVSDYDNGPIVTDDFIILSQSKIVGLRWWGGFAGWTQAVLPDILPTAFHLGIWSHDMQKNQPGALLWDHMASAWTYAFCGYQQGPGIEGLEPACYEFIAMLSQPQWFDPNVDTLPQFWLSIAAVYETGPPEYPWGWSTRPDRIWLDTKQITPHQQDWPPVIGMGNVKTRSLPLLIPGNWSMSFELFSLVPDPNGSNPSFMYMESNESLP